MSSYRVLIELVKKRFLRPMFPVHHRAMSNNAHQPKENEDSPVKFTTSKAASWSAKSSRGDIRRDAPWFEPYIILSSLSVFMLYFFVLREENDVDLELGTSLYDRIPGLEKKQLELSLSYNESHGLDTTDILNRLKEIEEEE